MIISLIVLALFLPAAFLPLALSTHFTPAALDEMGVCLESSELTHESENAQSSCKDQPISNPIQLHLLTVCG